MIPNCKDKPAGKDLERCKLNKQELGKWLKDVFSCPANFFIKIGYIHGTNLPGLAAEKLRSLAAVPFSVSDENAMLWSYQKRFADQVIQGMVEISKGRD